MSIDMSLYPTDVELRDKTHEAATNRHDAVEMEAEAYSIMNRAAGHYAFWDSELDRRLAQMAVRAYIARTMVAEPGLIQNDDGSWRRDPDDDGTI